VEDRNEVLRRAAEAGHNLSDDQLARMHRSGAIDEPIVERRGRKGTASLYPTGTTNRVLALLRHDDRRRLRERSWQTWWDEGGDIPPAARQFLQENAESFDRITRFLGRLIDRETRHSAAAERRMEQLREHARTSRLSGPLAAARRRVGKSGFQTVAHVFSQVGTGRFVTYGYWDVDEDGTPRPDTAAALVEKALGLDRARVDRLADAPPWYSGSSEADLARLSSLFAKRPLSELAHHGDAILEQSRAEFRAFITVITTTAALMESFFGRNAFGFGLFTRLLRWKRPGNQTVMLLGWILLSGENDLKKGMDEIVALEPKARAWADLQTILGELRTEIPAYGEVLTDRRIGKALRSASESARLSEEVAKIRSENLEAVDAFVRRQPQIDGLLTIAGE
jgi:hypothetical protein